MAERVQQRPQAARELRRHRDVVADVGAARARPGAVVVAQHAGVQLHDQAVLAGHARHLEQHVRRRTRARRPRSTCPRSAAATIRSASASGQRRRVGAQVAVVGGARTGRENAPGAPRAPGPGRGSRSIGKPHRCSSASASRQPGAVHVHHGVGPERRDHAVAPARPRRAGRGRAASESAASVVDRISMLNRSNSARGRNSGCASRSDRWSKSRSALRALGASVARRRPRRARARATASSGVPRNRCQCAANVRQIARGSCSTTAPSRRGTPSASCGTPCETSIRTR